MIYDVFISYSHHDKKFAQRLEAALKRFRSPIGSKLKRRLSVFRDESEGYDIRLTAALTHALGLSRKLVVVCSPASRQSVYVSEEIATFIAERGVHNVIPVLVAGMPNDEAQRRKQPGEAAFATLFIDKLGDTPWAPDFRNFDQPEKRIQRTWPAWFHLLAAIYEVRREDVEQLEKKGGFSAGRCDLDYLAIFRLEGSRLNAALQTDFCTIRTIVPGWRLLLLPVML